MDAEDQEEELIALQAIFSEQDYLRLSSEEDGQTAGTSSDDPHSLRSGDFSAQVQLPEAFQIKDFQGEKPTAILRFLPPIVLGFRLPKDYPSQSPPITHLSCKWLRPSQLSKLSRRVDELWIDNKGQPILYIWCDFLQQDSLSFLGIDNTLQIQEADVENSNVVENVTQDLSSPKLLFGFLTDYNKQQLNLEFEKQIWPCAVCFSDKLGRDSFKFYDCGHIFCKECMTKHFTVKIDEGEVNQLTCPEDNCNSQGHPSQLKDLLDKDVYERYERLSVQTALDSMLDVTYCPRSFCQTPVLLDPDNTMGTCSACHYVFCRNCKMSYHGIHPCNVKSSKLKEDLENATEEDMEAFKERYGRQFVETLIAETASYSWIDENCEPCPVCGCKIIKSDGCNKMTCTKCKAYFCWLCKRVLPRANPYSHYRNNPHCHLFPGEADVDVVFDEEEPPLVAVD